MTMTKKTLPVSSWMLIACGGWLLALGFYFIILRPPLLPEDARFMGATYAFLVVFDESFCFINGKERDARRRARLDNMIGGHKGRDVVGFSGEEQFKSLFVHQTTMLDRINTRP